MDMGCIVDMDQIAMYLDSNECAHVVASLLAERRRRLAVLAKRHLKSFEHLDSFKVIDGKAGLICEALDDANITFPQSLRVTSTYQSIYHYPWRDLTFLKIFFDNGFIDLSWRNDIGLNPIMRHLILPKNRYDLPLTSPEFERWLCEQACLGQRPRDPLGLGYNLHASGWHYLATLLAHWYEFSSTNGAMSWLFSLVEDEQFQLRNRDECVCWCNLGGKGCLPSKTFWKVVIQRSSERRFRLDGNIYYDPQSKLSLEFARLLTFETLGMTHTCCFLKKVDLGQVRKHQRSIPFPCENILLLFNHDQEYIRKVRSDDLELKDALLLDSLMVEFTREIKALSSSPTRTLRDFIWGYWRRRISEAFAVNSKAVDEMKLLVENVDTCKQSDWKFHSHSHISLDVLPERAQFLLGPDFKLLKRDPKTWADATYEHKGYETNNTPESSGYEGYDTDDE